MAYDNVAKPNHMAITLQSAPPLGTNPDRTASTIRVKYQYLDLKYNDS